MPSGRFRTNSPPVVYETVDNETIIVNLETGSYYDLNETGGYILGLLERVSTIPDVVGATAGRYGVDTAVAESAVEALLARLLEEQLVVPADGDRPAAADAPPLDGSDDPRPFAPPVLNKYTDMQELLLLDPVHEVDEAVGRAGLDRLRRDGLVGAPRWRPRRARSWLSSTRLCERRARGRRVRGTSTSVSPSGR